MFLCFYAYLLGDRSVKYLVLAGIALAMVGSMAHAGEVTSNGSTFTVEESVQQKHPEIVALVLNSQSLDNEEKQQWLNLIPQMTEEKIEKLSKILVIEKNQLSENTGVAPADIAATNQKHLEEWQELQTKGKK
jgi:hypothetical protein